MNANNNHNLAHRSNCNDATNKHSSPRGKGNIKLVVIDSIAFHMRQEFGDKGNMRTRILLETAQCLQTLACKFNIAVVVINQVTTKFVSSHTAYNPANGYQTSRTSPKTVPALGETWAHCPTTRVMLSWDDTRHMNKNNYDNTDNDENNANNTNSNSHVNNYNNSEGNDARYIRGRCKGD